MSTSTQQTGSGAAATSAGAFSTALGVSADERPFQWLIEDNIREEEIGLPAADVGAERTANRPQRRTHITEIRGPFHDIVGKHRLQDLFDAMEPDIDGVKFAGGAVMAMQRRGVTDLIDVAHDNGAYASCAGGIEMAFEKGGDAVQRYLEECRSLGFDAVEFGCAPFRSEACCRIVDSIKQAGLKAKAKLGTRDIAELGFCDDGGTSCRVPCSEAEVVDPSWVIRKAADCVAGGAGMVVINAEDLMEGAAWDSAAIGQLVDAVGMQHLLFEAPHNQACDWTICEMGRNANLAIPNELLLRAAMLRRRFPPYSKPDAEELLECPADGTIE